MDLGSALASISKKIAATGSVIETEEATKSALVMPFLSQVLGYDVFDPTEVIPEFVADTPSKKGEKVDYAIMNDGQVSVLIECKKLGENLNIKHASQLFRYFSVTKARLAVLTNGAVYQFFTDLDAPNRMDEKPFLELDLTDIDPHVVPEIRKLTKEDFDITSVINTAGELKYLSQIKKIINAQLKEPEEDFVKFFASRVYDSGILTKAVKEQFAELTVKAFKQFLNDKINERLKSAQEFENSEDTGAIKAENNDSPSPEADEDSKIETTQEELDGYNIIRAILRESVEIHRIIGRDTQSYFGVLLDDNNRKPICRLHFNRTQKYLGIMDRNKKETRVPIESLEDIFNYASQLKETVSFYE